VLKVINLQYCLIANLFFPEDKLLKLLFPGMFHYVADVPTKKSTPDNRNREKTTAKIKVLWSGAMKKITTD